MSLTIGEIIKARRISMGLSAEELAAKIGKNKTTIYRYESNEIEKLPINVLIPLAKALGLTPGELLACNVPEFIASAHEQQLIEKIRKLSADDLEELEAIIDLKLKKGRKTEETVSA